MYFSKCTKCYLAIRFMHTNVAIASHRGDYRYVGLQKYQPNAIDSHAVTLL